MQIEAWRAHLRKGQTITGQQAAELEDHLREQIASLGADGLSEDEAFLVAVKRMGAIDALTREFAREHSDRLWKQLVVVAGSRRLIAYGAQRRRRDRGARDRRGRLRGRVITGCPQAGHGPVVPEQRLQPAEESRHAARTKKSGKDVAAEETLLQQAEEVPEIGLLPHDYAFDLVELG
jgi:hypothetical protein